MDAKHGFVVAKQCQALAQALAPFQNRGTLEVTPAAEVPKSPLLREMTDRINAIRAEYGMPPVQVSAALSTKKVTEITNALLSAGNLLEHHARSVLPPEDLKEIVDGPVKAGV